MALISPEEREVPNLTMRAGEEGVFAVSTLGGAPGGDDGGVSEDEVGLPSSWVVVVAGDGDLIFWYVLALAYLLCSVFFGFLPLASLDPRGHGLSLPWSSLAGLDVRDSRILAQWKPWNQDRINADFVFFRSESSIVSSHGFAILSSP